MSEENEDYILDSDTSKVAETIDKLFKNKPISEWREIEPTETKTVAIKQTTSDGIYTVALVEYDSYKEILVFKCDSELLKGRPLISISFGITNHLCPIAKFPPFASGWEDAVSFVKNVKRR